MSAGAIVKWSTGAIPADVLERFDHGRPDLTAAQFQNQIASELESIGFVVLREQRVRYSDSRNGFIDMVARRGPLTLWLELDRVSPRTKSIDKLNYAVRTLGGSALVACRCS